MFTVITNKDQAENNKIRFKENFQSNKTTLYIIINKAIGEKIIQTNPYSNIEKKDFKTDFKD